MSTKFTVWVVATTMLLSLGFVLYPQGPANAAKFCAELRGAPGRLNCSFTSHHACRAHVRAEGGGRCHRWIGGRPVS
jgi:hypothetical protein